MEIGEYHHTDGWFFKRLKDGSVRIRVEGVNTIVTPINDTTDRITVGRAAAEHIIPPSEWASIVTAVAHFDDGVTYGMATRLHAGDSYDRRVAINSLEITDGR